MNSSNMDLTQKPKLVAAGWLQQVGVHGVEPPYRYLALILSNGGYLGKRENLQMSRVVILSGTGD